MFLLSILIISLVVSAVTQTSPHGHCTARLGESASTLDLRGGSSTESAPLNLQDSVELSANSENKAKDLGLQIEELYSRMKSFINDTTFDYLAFEAQAEVIKKKNLLLSGLVETGPIHEELLRRSRYLRRMFQAMFDSLDNLKTFGSSEEIVTVWLFKIIELNVRLFALQNIDGNLDEKKKDVSSTLLRYHHSVYYWSLQYENWPDLTPHKRLLFQSEAALARKTIEALQSQIPVPTHLMT
ncbi:hypothetical protein OXX59_001743 [Metschnikowia pulcherrima]